MAASACHTLLNHNTVQQLDFCKMLPPRGTISRQYNRRVAAFQFSVQDLGGK